MIERGRAIVAGIFGSRLARKQMLSILIFSSLVTLMGTGVQLYLEYRSDMDAVDSQLAQIRHSHLESLTNSLWAFNNEQVGVQLNNILSLRDMVYLEVRETVAGGEVAFSAGEAKPRSRLIRMEFPMVYLRKGVPERIGTLVAYASYDGVYQRMARRVLVIALTQGVKTFFVSFFILWILHRQVTRFLLQISGYAQNVNLARLDRPLAVNRGGGSRADELDLLVDAINAMRGRLVEDIATREENRRALEESEQRFRSLFENNHTVMLIIDPAGGRVVDANPAASKFYGWSREALCRKRMTEINTLPPEEVEAAIREVRTGRKMAFSFRHRLADGSRRDVDVYSGPIRIGGRELLCSIVHDVTERRRVEAALRENEERFRSLFESAPDGIIICDMEGRVTLWNAGAAAMFGYTAGELLGKTYTRIIPEAYRRRHREGMRRFLLEGEGKIPGKTVEVMGRRKDGSEFPLELSLAHWRCGESLYFAAITRDITERKRIETRLQQAQRMEAIGNLAGGIAHDFNNILFPIMGYSEMLMEELSSRADREEVGEILQAARRGRDLVGQILAFSRQTGQEAVPVRLQEILDEVLRLMRRTIPSNIEIGREIARDCAAVMADPTQLHQIAVNLITNAYHALGDSGGRISVTLAETAVSGREWQGSLLSAGTYARITVSDTGCGIDPATLEKIYEPYFTTKEKGKGTGLGLAVVYGIVRQYGGDVRVYSEVGVGTTFNVYLPLVAREPEEARATEASDLSGTERILLVDDEAAVAKLERRMLERLGYRVTTHTDSLAALAAFREAPDAFDLVITDMAMPKMTGDLLLEALVAVRPDIPVIICTGFSERINREKAVEMGVEGFLMKPVVKTEMARLVRRALERREPSGGGGKASAID